MSKLTTRDELDYDHYKQKAKGAWLKAKEGWFQWVEFVKPIRDRRLFLKEYKTFEEHCEIEYGITPQRVSQLINSAFVVQGLTTKLVTDVNTEAAARELAKVPAEKRDEVVIAAKRNGPVTAPAIKKAVAQITAKSEPKAEAVPVDDMGFPIPSNVLPQWEKLRNLVQGAMTAVSRAKSEITKLSNDARGGPLWDAVQELGMVHYRLAEHKPLAVCLECSGADANCRLCNGAGAIGKIRLRACPKLIEARIRQHNLAPYKPPGATIAIA